MIVETALVMGLIMTGTGMVTQESPLMLTGAVIFNIWLAVYYIKHLD